MKVIFVRHGVSEDAEWMQAYGKGDFDRPLTKDGAREMQKVAFGLEKLVPDISAILASPLVRAQQTAEILSRVYKTDNVYTEEALSHEVAPSDTLAAIGSRGGDETLICVGHQPNISTTISLALTGSAKSIIDMGRGASCGVYFASSVRAGAGMLLFHYPRKVFRD